MIGSWVPGLVAACLAGATLLLPAGRLSPASALAAESSRPDVGNRFPAVELTSLAGVRGRIAPDSPLPRATVLVFFAPQCAECFQEMAFFDTISKRTRELGLEVWAVEGTGLEAPAVEDILEGYRRVFGQPAYPVAADPEYRLSAQLGVRRLPTVFLVESHGVILSRKDGFADADAVDLVRNLEQLLKLGGGELSTALRNHGICVEDEQRIRESLSHQAAWQKPKAPEVRLLAPGDAAPSFTFTDLAGHTRQWPPESGIGGGGMIVFFWGALCLPCVQEMAFLEEVYEAVRDRGIEVLAVEASGQSAERTRVIMEQYRKFYPLPTYRILPDPGFKVSRLFGVGVTIPQTFLVNRDGVIVAHTDEFVQGPANVLTRKIELAFDLEPGFLEQRRVSGLAPFVQSPEAAEAPSVMVMEKKGEEFRSNLVEGDTYYREWEFDKALPRYLRCLELTPDAVAIRERVARIYEKQGRLKLAIEQWERVLAANSSHPDAQSRIAILKQAVETEKAGAER